jgi:cytochrome P450
VDEIITVFFAGMKTIQVSSANLIYHVLKNKDIRIKLLDEIRPPLDALGDDIVSRFSFQTAMDFEYL